MSAYYAVRHDYPNATRADVLWRVFTYEQTAAGGWPISHALEQDDSGRYLWVPSLNSWTLDTLRLVLHELAAFLPAHDATEAEVIIKAATLKPRGRRRADAPTPEPRVDPFSVTLNVQARGWRVALWTHNNCRDEGKPTETATPPSPGEWSVPMAAVLLNLAAASPIPLAGIGVVESAQLLVPSRRDTVRGLVEPDADDVTRVRRLSRLFTEIAHHAPRGALATLETLLTPIARRYGLDDQAD
jgi:hypothetical protein